MKPRSSSFVLATVAVVLILLSAGAAAAQEGGPATAGAVPTIDAGLAAPDSGGGPGPITPGFSYQGQLKTGSSLVNGTCDFQFSLWDQSGTGAPPTGGVQLGTTETQTAVPVSKGLFTAILNAGNQFTDLAFQAARWLQIAVRCPAGSGSYTTLSPRQPLWAAPYAQGLRPGTTIKGAAYQNLKVVSTAPTGGIPAGVTGEITVAADGVGVYGSNSVVAAGATGVGVWGRTWSEAGAGVKGTGLYYADGVFGESDGAGVHGQGDTGVLGVGVAQGSTGTGVLGRGEASGEGVWGRNTTGVAGRFDTNSSTTSPQVLLEENADDYARLSFENTTAGKAWTVAGYPSATDANARLNLWYSPIGDVMSLTGSGKVGIGTSSPDEKLVVYGGNTITRIAVDASGTGNTGIRLRQGGTARWSVATSGASGDFQIYEDDTGNNRLYIKGDGSGNVGIGTNNPTTRLDVAGTAAANIVQIRGGSDLAEKFDVVGKGAPEPGTLLVIDDAHPGKLMASSQPYDTRVAGIVSGAGGIQAGLILHQDGVLDGDTPVAVAGRVYVKADASSGPIRPGDLLTTSSIPGCAMKATDRTQAQGAIIGKALSALDKGQGLVLVLVSLQ